VPNEPIWLAFHNQLAEHCITNEFQIGNFNLMNTPREYEDSPFQMLKGGNKSTKYGQQLKPVNIPSYQISHANVVDIAEKVLHPGKSATILFFGTYVMHSFILRLH
jgi:hypothetical protein